MLATLDTVVLQEPCLPARMPLDSLLALTRTCTSLRHRLSSISDLWSIWWVMLCGEGAKVYHFTMKAHYAIHAHICCTSLADLWSVLRPSPRDPSYPALAAYAMVNKSVLTVKHEVQTLTASVPPTRRMHLVRWAISRRGADEADHVEYATIGQTMRGKTFGFSELCLLGGPRYRRVWHDLFLRVSSLSEEELTRALHRATRGLARAQSTRRRKKRKKR